MCSPPPTHTHLPLPPSSLSDHPGCLCTAESSPSLTGMCCENLCCVRSLPHPLPLPLPLPHCLRLWRHHRQQAVITAHTFCRRSSRCCFRADEQMSLPFAPVSSYCVLRIRSVVERARLSVIVCFVSTQTLIFVSGKNANDESYRHCHSQISHIQIHKKYQ